MANKQLTTSAKGVVFIRANLTAQIKKEKPKLFVSYCPELDLYSQGETIKEAKNNISEATQLFIQSCVERNTLREVLEECGFNSVYKQQPARKQRNKPVATFSGDREVQIPADIPIMQFHAQ